MKTRPRHFSTPKVWLPKPAGSGPYHHWLVDTGSLTARLQSRCSQFAVNRVTMQWGCPQQDECVILGLRQRERALLREVTLSCDGQPVVFAHSVLPRSSLRGLWRGLGHLGNKPLGEALFSDPAVVRTPLNFRKLMPQDALFLRAVITLESNPPNLWARRSVFMLNGATIMVTEVFLPGVLKF